MTERPPLSALAARAQLGDRVALDSLLRELERPLLNHVRAIVADEDAAADVLQDSLLIVCRRLSTLRDAAWVRAWAYRIASREAFRAARRRRHEPLDERFQLPDRESELPIVEPELLAELPRRLAALPPLANLAIRMHYLDELSQQEIAEVLGIPIGTVKSRIAYGLSALRRAWHADGSTVRPD